MEKIPTTKKKRLFRLKISLPTAFVLVILVTALSIIKLNHYAAIVSATEIAASVLNQISELALERTLNHLKPAEKIVRLNALSFEGAEPDEEFRKRFETVALNELSTYPQFNNIYFGDEDGNFLMAKRMPGGTLSTLEITRLDDSPECRRRVSNALALKNEQNKKAEISDLLKPCVKSVWKHRDKAGNIVSVEPDPAYAYDPRLRPWYTSTKANKTLTWTDLYVFASDNTIGISAAIPLYKNGELSGVFAIDIEMDELSGFLKSLKVGKGGRAFIINAMGKVIAIAEARDRIKTGGSAGSALLNDISNVSDAVAAKSFAAAHKRLGSSGSGPLPLKYRTIFLFSHGGEQYFGFYRTFPPKYKSRWIVGIVEPKADYMARAERYMLFSVAISIAGTILVLLISLYISRRITSPLDKLDKETQRVRNFDLEDPGEPVVSSFKEIQHLVDSFSDMRTGLRSFKKYVPADLVRYLISTGLEAEHGGKNQPVTILFSDIADFTSISESLTPDELVIHLNEYLYEMSSIITKEKGTIDKYIGDAIMAFWNAPKEVSGHATHACRAALACRDRLAELREVWRTKGLPEFHARIGINTGEVVVGNMGSEYRLNYTAIGDAVNVSSRFEGLGKAYAVEIIIGESVYELAKSDVEARLLDCVAVKGRKKGVFIYELMAMKGRLDERELEAKECYERGFKEYMNRNWNEAIALFKKAIDIGGEDTASEIFIARCHTLKRNPPPDDWDGVYVFTTK
ncbi:MAG: adenylate/guanylate cyclase domain-containing protein [bacterium]